MVTFTPGVQENPEGPNFFHYLEKTSKPEANTSGLYKGAGVKFAGQAAGAIEQAEAGGIKHSLTGEIRNAQDEQIEDLLSERNKLYAGDAKLVSPVAGGASDARHAPSILDTPVDGVSSKGEVPEDVKDYGRKTESIVGARKSGKIDMFDADMRILNMARKYRSMFPGFADEIDEITSRATGRTIANKVIAQLQGEINSFASAREAGASKNLTELNKDEVMGNLDPRVYNWARSEILQGGDRGERAMSRVMSIVQPIIAAQRQLSNQEKFLQVKKLNDDDYKKSQGETLSRNMNQLVDARLGSFMLGGEIADDWTPERLNNMPDHVLQQFDQEWHLFKNKTEAELRQLVNSEAYSKLYNSPEEKEKFIQDKLAPIQRNIDAYENQEYGYLHFKAMQNSAKVREGAQAYIKDHPELEAQTDPTIRQLMKDNPRFAQQVTEASKDFQAQNLTRMVGAATGHAFNKPSDVAKDMKASGSTGDQINAVIRTTMDYFEDPKASREVLQDALNNFYTDYEFIKNFKSPSFNSLTGGRSMGGVDLVDKATNPKFLAEVNSKVGKPGIDQMYNWFENAAHQDVIRKEVENLKNIRMTTVGGSVGAGKQLPILDHIAYDDTKKELKFIYNRNMQHTYAGETLETSRQTFNKVLHIVQNFQRYYPDMEPDEFVAIALQKLGYSLKGLEADDSVPAAIAKALHASIKGRTEEETDKPE